MNFIFYFTIGLFTLLSVNAHASSHQLAEKVCAIFSGNSYRLEDVFDSALLDPKLRPQLEAAIQNFRSDERVCQKVEPTQLQFPEAQSTTFTFVGLSSQMHLFIIESNTAGDRINLFKSVGALLPRDQWIYREEQVEVRDGVRLRTKIYLPADKQRRPTILGRTPYFKVHGRQAFEHQVSTADFYLRQGYAYVYQSIRGAHGSQGEVKLFSPQEVDDGYDTVAWIRNQSWSNGRIAAVGTSYEGLTALAVAASNAPGVDVVIAGAGPTDMGSGTFSTNGTLNLQALEYIHYLDTGEGVPFSDTSNQPPSDWFLVKIFELAAQNFDLRTYDRLLFGKELSEWRRLAEAFADPKASYWRERSFIRQLAGTKIPVIQLAGTRADGNMPDTLNNFRWLQFSPAAPQHRLVLGHWDHRNNTPIGSGTNMPEFVALRFNRWLAHYLRDQDDGVLDEAPIQLQSHTPGEWIGRDRWDEIPSNIQTFSLSAKAYEYDPTSLEDSKVTYDFDVTQPLKINGLWHMKMLLRTNVPQTNVTVALSKIDANGFEQSISMCASSQRLSGAGLHVFRPIGCFVFAELVAGEKLRATVFSNLFFRFQSHTGMFLARMTNRAPGEFWQSPLKAQIEVLEPSAMELEIEP